MATIIVPTNNPLITAPFVDPDESSYGEVPVEKQLELRVGNATPGAGALVEQRNSTSQIVEAERVGEMLLALDTAAIGSWDTNVTGTTVASSPTGYSNPSFEAQAASSSSQRGVRFPFVKDLSVYGGATLFSIHRRISSITNLTQAVLRFEFATSSDWAQYQLAAAGTTLNTWAELTFVKGSPQATNGTVAWNNVTAIRLQFIPNGSNYAGNLDVRDLRVGTTRTAKTSPDGHLAYESTYDFRVRYRDAATPTTVFGPWTSWVTIKPSQPPVVAAVTPNAGGTITDPTPAFVFTYTSPGSKAQASAYVDLYEVVGGQDQFVDRYSITGTGVSIPQPPFVLGHGKTYAWIVTATDTDGLTGSSARRTFTTNFSQPATPTSLSVFTDEDASSALIGWAGPLGALQEWRVYRRKTGGEVERISNGGGTWGEGDAPIVGAGIVDYHIPEGVAVEYLVTAHSGSASSEGESASVSESAAIITDRWMNVIPGIPDRTFEIAYVVPDSFTETPELQTEETEPIGRETIHVSVGEQLEARITFQVFMTRENRDIIAKLRSIASDSSLPYAVLKSPEGDVWRVQYGTIPKTYGEAGTRKISVPATVVAQ